MNGLSYELTPPLLVQAYASGVFPMAAPEMGNEIFWFAPDPRTIIPLDEFHVSRSLARTVRQKRFDVRMDVDFTGVIRACAAPRPEHEETWISEEIVEVYSKLFELGYAHTVECYLDDQLVGGLYGVSLGGAFFGESMFHKFRDASKVALVHLVRHLKAMNYQLLDVQYMTEHLRRFGAREIPRRRYEELLSSALQEERSWNAPVRD